MEVSLRSSRHQTLFMVQPSAVRMVSTRSTPGMIMQLPLSSQLRS